MAIPFAAPARGRDALSDLQLDAFTTRRFGDGYLDGEIELI